jgi:hypothetical protein
MKTLIRFNSAAMLLLCLPMAGTLAQSESGLRMTAAWSASAARVAALTPASMLTGKPMPKR